MSAKSNDLIILLGAGASVEAGIPASATMVGNIEKLLINHQDWAPYGALYNHVKSAIFYASGLKGLFHSHVVFNIETLVNTLYELERNEDHPVYPFIGSWNSRFLHLAGNDLARVREFRRMILKELKKWICPLNSNKRSYFKGLERIQKGISFPLSIFSLNYDLCVEYLHTESFRVESGFEGYGPDFCWNWERFEPSESVPDNLPEAFLYKLHGSINWKRDGDNNLFSVEQVESVDADLMDIIFGRDFKLEAADPYLFYAYQFRRSTMDCKLLVSIGYGFADSHINKMITQGLRTNEKKRIHVVTHGSKPDSELSIRTNVSKILEVSEDRVTVEACGAKAFLEKSDVDSHLLGLIPNTDETPF